MQEVDREKVAEEVVTLLDQHSFKKAKDVWSFLTTDLEIQGSIKAGNRLAVKYLKFTDHGLDHVTIVCRNVLQIIEVVKADIVPALINQEIGDWDDVALVCLVACYLHDVGHIVHRKFHELISSIMVKDLIYSKLKKIYPDADRR